jgi:hypothetical protein
MQLLVHPGARSGRCQPALLAGCTALFLLGGFAWRLTDRLDAATRPWAEVLDPVGPAHRRVPSVTLVFRMAECALALRDIERWNALHRQGAIDVRGVVLDPPRGLPLNDLTRQERITFPILTGRTREVGPRLRALGVANTPVSLILDRQGSVRLVLPAARQLDGFGLVDSLLAGL